MNDDLPQHIVVIPDGNRRWAREKNLKPWIGHREGLGRFKELAEESFKLGIPFFSFWGLSIDNIKNRSKKEIDFLLDIFEENLKKLFKNKEIHEKKTRIRILGFWRDFFPKNLCQLIDKIMDATKNYNKFNLNLLLAYNGTDEMLRAVREITRQAKENSKLKITKDLIKKNLFTKDLPPVDYLIRTGGEPHWSAGFLMWDIANAQFYFTNTYFPDFDKQELHKAIKEYQRRERRLGT